MKTKLKGAGVAWIFGLMMKLTPKRRSVNTSPALKGAGVAWIFGLMMVLVVVAVFAVGVTMHYDAQVTIVSAAVEAYDTVHVSELIKRTLDGAAFANAKETADELALNGGGIAVWTDTPPSTDALAAKLETELERKTDLIEFEGLSGREIIWGKADITITSHDDNGFTFSGKKPFTVVSMVSTPQMAIQNNGAFGKTLKTNYFKLLRLGIAAAKCPPAEGTSTADGVTQTITSTAKDTYLVSMTGSAGGTELKYTLDCKGAKTA